MSLVGAVIELLEHGEGGVEMSMRLEIGAEAGAGVTQVVAGARLSLQVVKQLRGTQRDPLGGLPLVPLPLLVEEVRERPGELPGASIGAGFRQVSDDGQQD